MLEDENNLGLDDYTGYYIVGRQGNYIDGPFDDHRIARHEYDTHDYGSYHTEELTDDEYRDRWFS
jgi:hypothetical protein